MGVLVAVLPTGGRVYVGLMDGVEEALKVEVITGVSVLVALGLAVRVALLAGLGVLVAGSGV